MLDERIIGRSLSFDSWVADCPRLVGRTFFWLTMIGCACSLLIGRAQSLACRTCSLGVFRAAVAHSLWLIMLGRSLSLSRWSLPDFGSSRLVAHRLWLLGRSSMRRALCRATAGPIRLVVSWAYRIGRSLMGSNGLQRRAIPGH